MQPLTRRPARLSTWLAMSLALAVLGCAADKAEEGRRAGSGDRAGAGAPGPSILLVTLDTTRADHLGFDRVPSESSITPSLDAVAARGTVFSQAYTTAPLTLPAHASMLTGLYVKDHGIHENGRSLGPATELLAERLQEAGYGTIAVVSAYPLARQYGLARGFDRYLDDFGAGANERHARDTTALALQALDSYLEQNDRGPLFLWVHYYDPHEPYAPPEPYRSRFADDPYRGEIAYLDEHVGALIEGFESALASGEHRLLVVGDHGEGRGEHGELLHGNLLYQGVMRVPLVLAGTGVTAGRIDRPVSVRRVFDTTLDWAGVERRDEATVTLQRAEEPVLAEAMTPYLQYGWQPQIMAVAGSFKAIRSNTTELYDVVADPAEQRDLSSERRLPQALREALRSYPLTASADAGDAETEDQRRLASLGYVGGSGEARLQPDAPAARDMTAIFGDLDRSSRLFVERRYGEVIPIFERILGVDPGNVAVLLRLAVAHSFNGAPERALELFGQARDLAPSSVDARHYLAMHYFRTGDWERAEPLFVEVLERMPRRLPALECLAQIRERQGRAEQASDLLRRIIELKQAPARELERLAHASMALGRNADAISAFEQALALDSAGFTSDLELGVCYLADRQLEAARDALDRVEASHPAYAMALFKRAQVSVLLQEADRVDRVRRAYRRSDAEVRRLIESETLFRGMLGEPGSQ